MTMVTVHKGSVSAYPSLHIKEPSVEEMDIFLAMIRLCFTVHFFRVARVHTCICMGACQFQYHMYSVIFFAFVLQDSDDLSDDSPTRNSNDDSDYSDGAYHCHYDSITCWHDPYYRFFGGERKYGHSCMSNARRNRWRGYPFVPGLRRPCTPMVILTVPLYIYSVQVIVLASQSMLYFQICDLNLLRVYL